MELLIRRNDEKKYEKYLPAEVFLTVFDGFGRRFISDARDSPTINNLMDQINWWYLCQQKQLPAPERREEFLQVYITNLKSKIYKSIILKFAMKDQISGVFHRLIYLTSDIKCIKAMKTSMWKQSDNAEEMKYSKWDGTAIMANDVDTDMIADLLFDQIKTTYQGETISGETIGQFVWLETLFLFSCKQSLKKLLQNFAINNERTFEKIMYSFPKNDTLAEITN